MNKIKNIQLITNNTERTLVQWFTSESWTNITDTYNIQL